MDAKRRTHAEPGQLRIVSVVEIVAGMLPYAGCEPASHVGLLACIVKSYAVNLSRVRIDDPARASPVLAYAHDLERIRAAGFAHRLADGKHDEVAAVNLTLLQQQAFGGAQDRVAVAALVEEQRPYVAEKRHLSLRRHFGRQRKYWTAAVVT